LSDTLFMKRKITYATFKQIHYICQVQTKTLQGRVMFQQKNTIGRVIFVGKKRLHVGIFDHMHLRYNSKIFCLCFLIIFTVFQNKRYINIYFSNYLLGLGGNKWSKPSWSTKLDGPQLLRSTIANPLWCWSILLVPARWLGL